MRMSVQVHGRITSIRIDGLVYTIESREVGVNNQDAYLYHLPNGDSYSHPTKYGALLMCLKEHAGGSWEAWE
jgi:hypothetical protein